MKSSVKRALLIAIPVALGAAAIMYFTTATVEDPEPTKENCITISRRKVNSWLSEDWNLPASSNYVPSLVFVPVPGDPIMVGIFPVDAECNILTRDGKEMKIGDFEAKCSFIDGLKLTYSRLDFSDKFVDTDGNLIDFDFLRIVPMADREYPTMLGFKIELIEEESGSRERVVVTGYSKPCPPYCPISRPLPDAE